MKFSTADEMLQTILNGQDLYSPSAEIYVYAEDCSGAIAYYYIDQQEAEKLREEAADALECWSSLLGAGGYIVDSKDYLKSRGEYDDDSYLPLDWCKDHLEIDDWEEV